MLQLQQKIGENIEQETQSNSQNLNKGDE
jgi:hypothetical protein